MAATIRCARIPRYVQKLHRVTEGISLLRKIKNKLIIYNRDGYRIRNQNTFCCIYLILFMYALLFNDNCYYLLKNLLNIIYVRFSYRYSIYIFVIMKYYSRMNII